MKLTFTCAISSHSQFPSMDKPVSWATSGNENIKGCNSCHINMYIHVYAKHYAWL